VDRLLKSVASAAFGLARGLRQRTYVTTENGADSAAAVVQTGDTAAAVEINAGNNVGPSSGTEATGTAHLRDSCGSDRGVADVIRIAAVP
jgi:hypothetical protein